MAQHGHVAQYLRQLGRSELAGSTRAVTESAESKCVGHEPGHLNKRGFGRNGNISLAQHIAIDASFAVRRVRRYRHEGCRC